MPMTEVTTAAVRLGSDRLLGSTRLRGARAGIVCNHASLDRGFVHIVDRLASEDGVTLAAIFGPQHGFRSDVQDNMIETPHGDDPARRVPVYSLYSETREPTAEMLDRKSTRLNSSHLVISYAVFCLKTKTERVTTRRSGSSAASPPS